MQRRQFITLVGGTVMAWPLAARAQSGARHKVAVLMNGAATEARQQSYYAAFVEELRRLGWIEGQNLEVQVRWNAGDAELSRLYAGQLIGLMPDVIVSSSTTNLIAIRQGTVAISVVFLQVSDPVAQGFVASLTKPGGNLTGFGMYEFSIGGKWLGLLKEIAPGLNRVGVMFNPDTSPQSKFFMRSIEASAPILGVQVSTLPIHATSDIASAIEDFSRQPNGGLVLPTDTFTRLRWPLMNDHAIKHRLPTIGAEDGFCKDGGLMSYSANVDLVDQYRQAAGYVNRILKGEKPGDLPIQMANRYKLTINFKVAKALGIDVPPGLSARADEVME
jgi:putative tryptophan/tyrosine transport system substrate-binding protein